MDTNETDRAIELHAAATQQGPYPQTADEIRQAIERGDMEVVRLDADRTDIIFVSPDGL